jgi:hypothetical protein
MAVDRSTATPKTELCFARFVCHISEAHRSIRFSPVRKRVLFGQRAFINDLDTGSDPFKNSANHGKQTTGPIVDRLI